MSPIPPHAGIAKLDPYGGLANNLGGAAVGARKNGLVIAGVLIGAASGLLIGFITYRPRYHNQYFFTDYFAESGMVFLIAGAVIGGAIGYAFLQRTKEGQIQNDQNSLAPTSELNTATKVKLEADNGAISPRTETHHRPKERTEETGPRIMPSDLDSFYEKAFLELEKDQRNIAIWSRSFTEAEGDAEKAKVLYISSRVKALSLEHAKKLKIEADHVEAKKRIALAVKHEAERLEAAAQQTQDDIDSVVTELSCFINRNGLTALNAPRLLLFTDSMGGRLEITSDPDLIKGAHVSGVIQIASSIYINTLGSFPGVKANPQNDQALRALAVECVTLLLAGRNDALEQSRYLASKVF